MCVHSISSNTQGNKPQVSSSIVPSNLHLVNINSVRAGTLVQQAVKQKGSCGVAVPNTPQAIGGRKNQAVSKLSGFIESDASNDKHLIYFSKIFSNIFNAFFVFFLILKDFFIS